MAKPLSTSVLAAISPVDLGWVAGIIEGEGCLRVSTHPVDGRHQPFVCVKMTDDDVIRRLHAVTGIGRLGAPARSPSTPAHHKDQSSWIVAATSEVHSLLTAILPLLGDRRSAKALELLACCEEKWAAEKLRKTFCRRGHPRDEFGYKAPSNGAQMCHVCRQESIRKQSEKRGHASTTGY